MTLSLESLISIYEQASSLDERLDERFTFQPSASSEVDVEAKMERWCQVIADGDAEGFRKRLLWDGLEEAEARAALGGVHWRRTGALPPWCELLQAVVEEAHQDDVSVCTGRRNPLDPAHPLPFEEVLLPFLMVARRRLREKAAPRTALLTPKAHGELERALLKHLCLLSAHTLEHEFSLYRARSRSTLMQYFHEGDPDPRMYYRQFIRELLDGELVSFFLKYAVLARLVATAISFWIERISEFIHHLAEDLPSLEAAFGVEDAGEVVTAKLQLQETHQQGSTVISVTFSSGLKVLYKPRSLELDQGYYAFLAWLNERFEHAGQKELKQKILKVVTRSTHGWVEFVDHEACEGADEVTNYYRRAGALLCLLHLLRATDCHFENVIACGSHPVLVDVETLMQSYVSEEHRSYLSAAPNAHKADAEEAARRWLQRSVLRTDLLPSWVRGADGSRFDIAALSAVADQQTPLQKPVWKGVNTDHMELHLESVSLPEKENLPVVEDAERLPHFYLSEIAEGFTQTYRLLMNHREELLSPQGPLAPLAGQRTRFVLRNTMSYSSLLQRTLQPGMLKDGADRSIELDALCRPYMEVQSRPPVWSILKYERRALEELDVPIFHTAADSRDFTVGDTTLDAYLDRSGHEGVLNTLQRMSEKDLTSQINLIRWSLGMRAAEAASSTANGRVRGAAHSSRSNTVMADERSRAPKTPLSHAEIIGEAGRLVRVLRNQVVWLDQERSTWVTPSSKGKHRLAAVSADLMNGRCGIALCLAAAESVLGDARAGELARAALRPLRLRLSAAGANRQFVEEAGLGGASGFGSMLYTLVQMARLLDDDSYLEEALRLALLLRADDVAADEHLDVMDGTAGALLGLLVVYGATGEERVLRRARACGRHLMNQYVSYGDQAGAWPTLEGAYMTGFAHGASGIAYALTRLYGPVDNAEFIETARHALAYEHQVLDPTTSKWSPLTDRPHTKRLRHWWCGGAPGMALARAAARPAAGTEAQAFLKNMLSTLQEPALQQRDHVCCGNFGRVEALNTCADLLARPQLRRTATSVALRVVRRARRRGYYRFTADSAFQPSPPAFFKGAAGVAYSLLRLAYPNVLPCVLLWQSMDEPQRSPVRELATVSLTVH